MSAFESGPAACHYSIDLRDLLREADMPIVMSRQFASCRFRLDILLSQRGPPTRHQSSHSVGIYLHDLCSIVIQISVYMYIRVM
jgi:hypothetical protein